MSLFVDAGMSRVPLSMPHVTSSSRTEGSEFAAHRPGTQNAKTQELLPNFAERVATRRISFDYFAFTS
jgi:hypothetical protein